MEPIQMSIVEFGQIDNLVFYIFCAVAAVIVILSFVNIIVSCICCCTRNIVPSASIDFNIACGCLLLSVMILFRGFDPVWDIDADNNTVLEILCQIYPTVQCVGLTMFFGGLFVKSWSTYLFYKYNNDKRPLTEEWKPNLWIWFLLIVIALVSIVWSIEYTPELYKASLEPYTPGANTYGCESEHEFEWLVGTYVWHGFLLLLAVIAVPFVFWVTSEKQGRSEATIICLVNLNSLFTVFAILCMWFIFTEEEHEVATPTVRYTIVGALTLWGLLFAEVVFLIGTLVCTRNTPQNEEYYDTIRSDYSQNTGAANTGGNTAGSTTSYENPVSSTSDEGTVPHAGFSY